MLRRLRLAVAHVYMLALAGADVDAAKGWASRTRNMAGITMGERRSIRQSRASAHSGGSRDSVRSEGDGDHGGC